eukprot:scaffold5067_cov245-Pinguiococcus_pyrenoidosus.AAC.15
MRSRRLPSSTPSFDEDDETPTSRRLHFKLVSLLPLLSSRSHGSYRRIVASETTVDSMLASKRKCSVGLPTLLLPAARSKLDPNLASIRSEDDPSGRRGCLPACSGDLANPSVGRVLQVVGCRRHNSGLVCEVLPAPVKL